ncbi:YggT family protein [bacterium]|nr:YggT family protein [bacterium]
MIQEPGILGQTIDRLFQCLTILLLIRVILSWIPHDPFNRIIAVIHQLTDPILNPIKQFLPPLGGIDLSPLVAFFILDMIKTLLLTFL